MADYTSDPYYNSGYFSDQWNWLQNYLSFGGTGLKDIASLMPQLQQIGAEQGLTPEDFAKSSDYYQNHFQPYTPDATGYWGPQTQLRTILSFVNDVTGKNINVEQYLNRSVEAQQQKAYADQQKAEADQHHSSGLGDFGTLVALAGLGFGGAGLLGLLGEGAVGLSAADAIIGAGGLEAGGAGIIGDLAATAGTTAAGSAGGLSGIVDFIVNAAPSIESLAQKAAMNAASQLITTGNIDPSKVLTFTLAGAAGSALGGAAGAAAGGGLVGSIVSGAVNGVTQAAITGADPRTAGLASAAASGLGFVAKNMGVSVPQPVINAVVNSVATGAPLSSTLTSAALTIGSGLVKDAVSSNSGIVSPATPDIPTVADNPSAPIGWEDLQAKFDQLTPEQRDRAWAIIESTGDLNAAINTVMTEDLPPQDLSKMVTTVTGLSGTSPSTTTKTPTTSTPATTGTTGTTGTTSSGSNVTNPYATAMLGFSPWLQPHLLNTPNKQSDSNLFEGLSSEQSALVPQSPLQAQQKTQDQFNYVPIERSDISDVTLPMREGGAVEPKTIEESIANNSKRIDDILASWNAKPSSSDTIGDYLNRRQLASSRLDFAPFLKPSLMRGRAARPEPLFSGLQSSKGFADGGVIDPSLADVLARRNFPLRKEFVSGPEGHMYARHAERGFAVGGPGTGQSDDIPTMLSDGEYVIDADTVAALGDGSSKAGASILDKFRQEIRRHKRSAPADDIPPKAKSPMQYLKMAQKRK